MKPGVLRAALLILLVPYRLEAQSAYGRTRRNASAPSPAMLGAYKGVLVTFHGKLKVLDKKKIVIETEDNQNLSLRVSSKTKFVDNGKTVKPSSIDLDTLVTVEASEDTDLSLLVANVSVDSQQKPNPK